MLKVIPGEKLFTFIQMQTEIVAFTLSGHVVTSFRKCDSTLVSGSFEDCVEKDGTFYITKKQLGWNFLPPFFVQRSRHCSLTKFRFSVLHSADWKGLRWSQNFCMKKKNVAIVLRSQKSLFPENVVDNLFHTWFRHKLILCCPALGRIDIDLGPSQVDLLTKKS
jgi:hypothetical protein